MKRARLLLLVAVVATVLLLGLHSPAQAQSTIPNGSDGFPYPGWLGYFGSPYSLGKIPVPPYFSLHPPVYYSYPVARSYGYSPYAYPGSFQSPEVVMPQVIENPYVQPQSAPQPKEEPTVREKTVSAASYQIIENPFVRSANALRDTPLSYPETRLGICWVNG